MALISVALLLGECSRKNPGGDKKLSRDSLQGKLGGQVGGGVLAAPYSPPSSAARKFSPDSERPWFKPSPTRAQAKSLGCHTLFSDKNQDYERAYFSESKALLPSLYLSITKY